MSIPEMLPRASLITNVPTVDEIERISQLEIATLRNLQITQCYWELSKAFASRTGTNANWCTFATWASKQAGVTIRGEDLQRTLEQALENEPAIKEILSEISNYIRSLGYSKSQEAIHKSIIAKLVQGAVARASDAVARGNKKVFEEIGREFARFIATCLLDKEYNEASIQNYCKQLRGGDPPDGQDYLKRAFNCYYQSFFEPDSKKQQELQFLANIEIGYHEQTRLQPEIAESLNAAFVDPEHVKGFVSNILLTGIGTLGKVIYAIAVLRGTKSLLNRAIDKLVIEVQRNLRTFISAELMTLTIPPDTCLRLGKDIGASFPADLQQLTNPDLLAFLTRVDPTSNSLEYTSATDWSMLTERLHYIADLFRCYHGSKDLFGEAFSAEQLIALKTGKIPAGKL
jgi:hypothetical protein